MGLRATFTSGSRRALYGIVLVGCGRLGFDLNGARPDGGGPPSSDAVVPGGRPSFNRADGASGGRIGAGGTGDGGALPTDGGGAASASDASAVDGTGGASAGAGGSPGGDGGEALDVRAGDPSVVASYVSAGFSHTCAIDARGRLYCWGDNASLALGAAGTGSLLPQLVSSPGSGGGFVQVSAGRDSTCALHENGEVWCWGTNQEGNLGTGDRSDQATPFHVSLARPALQISVRERVSCAVLEGGALWCWGDNAEGQMGQGTAGDDALVPIQVPGSNWTAVSAGQGHVCALRAPGSLWCWGRNSDGSLGQGSTDPVQIQAPVQVGMAEDWLMVSASQSQTCGIRAPGTLWCWGANGSSQLGQGDTMDRHAPAQIGTDHDWTTVSQSALHACALKQPGALWCWGRNDEGQLGLPYDPVPVPTPARIGDESDWVELTSGWMHTCVRASDDSLWCTGNNGAGEVGDGTTDRPYALVEVAAFP